MIKRKWRTLVLCCKLMGKFNHRLKTKQPPVDDKINVLKNEYTAGTHNSQRHYV